MIKDARRSARFFFLFPDVYIPVHDAARGTLDCNRRQIDHPVIPDLKIRHHSHNAARMSDPDLSLHMSCFIRFLFQVSLSYEAVGEGGGAVLRPE